MTGGRDAAAVKGTDAGAECRSANDAADRTPSIHRPEATPAPPLIGNLSGIAAVDAYLRRIGATPRSMRKAVVQVCEGGYRRDRVTIELTPDGEIALDIGNEEDRADYEPADGEREAIRLAAKAVRFPELQPVATIRDAPAIVREAAPEDVFEFRDSDGNIVMLQVRIVRNGERVYIPFTFWSDGRWRALEPEGLLPIWGIDQLRLNSTVILHEGATAARTIRRMIEARTPEAKKALAEHPWGRDLQHAAHLGWIGGALSPHRTDWSVLARAGVKKVIIVADHDEPGVSAVPKIAKLLRLYAIEVWVIRFDGRFPVSFDLGNPFPKRMLKGGGCVPLRYTGPSFADCLEPATWATRVGSPPAGAGRGRPAPPPVYLRREFAAQHWMWVGENKTFYAPRHDPARMNAAEQFNTRYAPFCDGHNIAALFKTQAYDAAVQAVVYEPGEPAIINDRGVRSLNRWTPTRVVAGDGDIAPFELFMTNLFPIADDRWEMKRWTATLIALPSVRMRYGLLMASAVQGVGKTTFCEKVLRPLVGEQNCSAPSSKDIVESQFNGWFGCKRLVYVNEIYEGKSWTAYNKIKTYITDDLVQMNEKFMPSYPVRNWAHVALCSNSDLALLMDEQDRRFLVPTLTEQRQPASYWAEFHEWLAGEGLGVIRRWAEEFVKHPGHAVGPADHAPMSGRKRQMIEDSRSPEERLVFDLAAAALGRAADGGRPVVLAEMDVADWLQRRPGAREFKANIVRKWLRTADLHVSPSRLKVDGTMQHVSGTLSLDGKGWPELAAYRVRADDLGGM